MIVCWQSANLLGFSDIASTDWNRLQTKSLKHVAPNSCLHLVPVKDKLVEMDSPNPLCATIK